MQSEPIDQLSVQDRLFFGVGEVDWLIEQGLIFEEETLG